MATQIIASLQRDRLNYEMVIVRQRKELYRLSRALCEATGQGVHAASLVMSSPPRVLKTPVRTMRGGTSGSPASFDRLLDLDESVVSTASSAPGRGSPVADRG